MSTLRWVSALMAASVFTERRDFYKYIVINVWRRMDDQAQRAPSGIHHVRKICVNQCKSVSKKRPGDTDFTDYDVAISESSARSVVFSMGATCILEENPCASASSAASVFHRFLMARFFCAWWLCGVCGGIKTVKI